MVQNLYRGNYCPTSILGNMNEEHGWTHNIEEALSPSKLLTCHCLGNMNKYGSRTYKWELL